MNTQEIANALCEHCRNGTEAEGLRTLYADTAESVEAMVPDHMDKVSKGRDAIKAKHDWWNNAMQVNSTDVDGPYVNGDAFSVIFTMDVTDKSSGKSWSGKEVGLYEVEDGKIVRETFYMPPMG